MRVSSSNVDPAASVVALSAAPLVSMTTSQAFANSSGGRVTCAGPSALK